MDRDIDIVIAMLKRRCPDVVVQQLPVAHPGVDDDGLWFFRHPSRPGEVQLESSTGAAPFLVESDYAPTCIAGTPQEAAELVVSRLGLEVPTA
jgi:hypothetical protein